MDSGEQKHPVRPRPKSYCSAPFLWIDWICQWIAFLAGNLAVFRVLEYAGKLTVLVALIAWISDYPQRQKAAIRTAWSVVDANGGGRKEALQYLADRRVDLRGLYGRGGYFGGVVLTGLDLSWSELSDANFESADLTKVNLQGSKVSGTSFKNAILTDSVFVGAVISDSPLTNFQGARIGSADFRGAKIIYMSSSLSSSSETRIIQSFAAARDWQSALFDDRIRQAIECAADPGKASCQ